MHQWEEEITKSDPTSVPNMDSRDWSKSMKYLELYIWDYYVVSGLPLSYVFHNQMRSPSSADNPLMDHGTLYEDIIY